MVVRVSVMRLIGLVRINAMECRLLGIVAWRCALLLTWHGVLMMSQAIRRVVVVARCVVKRLLLTRLRICVLLSLVGLVLRVLVFFSVRDQARVRPSCAPRRASEISLLALHQSA